MKRKPLFEETADGIMDMIQEKYPPGSKIPIESELMDIFNVSRTTIRAAISSLRSKNILEIRRGDGTYVAEIPGLVDDPLGLQFLDQKQAFTELGEISYIIQPAAARMAAQNHTDDDLKKLDSAIRQLKESYSLYKLGSVSYPEIRQIDSLFHAEVIYSSHNRIMERINDIFEEFYRNTREHRNIGIIEESIYMHQQIYDAIAAGDADKAESLMLEHLHHVTDFLDSSKYPEEVL